MTLARLIREPQGLPLGARIVTRRGGDAACLMWGAWLHGARHG